MEPLNYITVAAINRDLTASRSKLIIISSLLPLINLFLISLLLCEPSFAANDKKTITINQFVNHPALDKATEGIRAALKNRNILPNNAEVLFSNAQGNISNSVQISKHHAGLEPKFMVAIATPSAQTNLKAMGLNSILAFVAVTDPEAANLVGSNNIIGVYDNPPIEALLNIAIKILPELKNIGVVYNAGEINSVKIINNLESFVKEKGIKLHLASINNSSDIKLAMQKLSGKVDVIYLPLDNSVVSAIDSIVAISKNSKVPLICNDPDLVERGALIGLGANYFNSGLQLGYMIADIMEEKQLEQNIQPSKSVELKINREMATFYGISIPNDLVEGEQK